MPIFCHKYHQYSLNTNISPHTFHHKLKSDSLSCYFFHIHSRFVSNFLLLFDIFMLIIIILLAFWFLFPINHWLFAYFLSPSFPLSLTFFILPIFLPLITFFIFLSLLTFFALLLFVSLFVHLLLPSFLLILILFFHAARVSMQALQIAFELFLAFFPFFLPLFL